MISSRLREQEAAEGVPPLGAVQPLSEGVPSARAPVDPEAVDELASWGFEQEAVVVALQATGGDRERAANMLLG